MVFVAGQIGWNSECVLKRIFSEANPKGFQHGGGPFSSRLNPSIYPDDLVHTSRKYLEQQKEIGKAYREIIGKHYPAGMSSLFQNPVEEAAKVQIETAVIPEVSR